jgi:hypothetical protein
MLFMSAPTLALTENLPDLGDNLMQGETYLPDQFHREFEAYLTPTVYQAIDFDAYAGSVFKIPRALLRLFLLQISTT